MDRPAMMTLAAINAMPAGAFEVEFASVAEHSPWVARRAAASRPFATRDAMVEAFTNAIANASRDMQLALIRCHPDLAGKAELTRESSREQAGEGLDRLTESEFRKFTQLNTSYKLTFGFPFILAVKGAGKQRILESMATRLNNSENNEFATALSEVCRILRLRIEDTVSP